MRSLIVVALVLVACSGGDRSNPPVTRTASSAPAARGPDALVLRVPRKGGVARVTAYPDIDSVVWTGADAAPALARVLAFDADAGLLAAVDSRGYPVWLDLRVGTVTLPSHKPPPPRGPISVDAGTIFAVGSDGAVVRFAPPGNWVFKPPMPARAVFPQLNGTLLVLGGRGASAKVWRMHPPEPALLDSLELPEAARGIGAPLGDRVYFMMGSRTLVGVHARTLEKGQPIELPHAIFAVSTTPSGDRLFVVTDSSRELQTVSRYKDEISGHTTLPGAARDLRVDPFGRYLLVRPATGDSVWVVSVGSDQVIGTLRTAWRGDLPFVAPDGAVAVTDGEDVAFIDPSSLKEVHRAAGGADDFWYPFVWKGFRPRDAALDRPAQLPGDSDSVVVALPVRPDSGGASVTPPDSVKQGFTVSFAALLDEGKARAEAQGITVEGRTARVVTSVTDGTAIYRVVLGPFPTRDEAERVGKASGKSYYVYAGSP